MRARLGIAPKSDTDLGFEAAADPRILAGRCERLTRLINLVI